MYVFDDLRVSARYWKRCGDADWVRRDMEAWHDEMRSLGPGDIFDYGHYYLAGTSFPNDVMVNSPITWIVINKEGSRLLALSMEPLYWNCFDGGFPYLAYQTSWQKSYIRKELNEEFFDKWFDELERDAIADTVLIVDGTEIHDKLFFLDRVECERYLKHPMMRIGLSHFADKGDDGVIQLFPVIHPWWLRNTGKSDELVMIMGEDGVIDEEGISCTADEIGIRPAMWLNLDKLQKTV